MAKKKKGTTVLSSDVQPSTLHTSSQLSSSVPSSSWTPSTKFYSISLFFLITAVSVSAHCTSAIFRDSFQNWNEYLESAFIKINKVTNCSYYLN